MNLPERLTMMAIDESGAPIEGVLLQFKATTGKKSPYYIRFPKTDASGCAALTKAEVVGQWQDHWEGGLMDYQGTLADALPVVELSLFDNLQLAAHRQEAMDWPLFTHERSRWRSRAELIDYMLSARNAQYHLSPTQLNLENNSTYTAVLAHSSTKSR